jgi:hypothetical protein
MSIVGAEPMYLGWLGQQENNGKEGRVIKTLQQTPGQGDILNLMTRN